MKYFFPIVAFVSLVTGLVTGCRTPTVPVSFHSETTTERDTTIVKSDIQKDSTHIAETMELKILPTATVGITLTKAQLDSLITALGTLPSSVEKVIYYQDPKTRAMLSVMLDSLQRIQITCTATEQKYYEKTKEQTRTISQLQNELRKERATTTTLQNEVRQTKIPWYTRLMAKLGSFGTFLIGFLAVIFFLGWIFRRK